MLIEAAKKQGIPVQFCEKSQLNNYLPQVNHQGVVVSCSRYPTLGFEDLLMRAQKQSKPPILLMLDRIQDPQNLGACLRSAAAFGVSGIIIPKNQAVGLTPAVIKVAVGAAAIVPVVTVVNLARAMRQLKEAGFWLYGTCESSAQSITQANVEVPVVWVLGNETSGLGVNVRKNCDALFVIDTESFSTLNIATSASICLYQTLVSRSKA